MKVIFFLDIDEVLNLDWSGTWDKNSVATLNTMTSVFNAKYVVSSTWKNQYNIDQLQKIFIEQGVEGEIIDYTPTISQVDRGVEINTWIEDNDYDGVYLIIDDKIKDIVEYFPNDYILHCVDDKGITTELAKEAAHKILKQEFKE